MKYMVKIVYYTNFNQSGLKKSEIYGKDVSVLYKF